MRTTRLRRPAGAGRLSVIILVGALADLSSAQGAPAADRDETVVEQSGQALPRAYVRLLDGSPAQDAATFADEAGRFRFRTTGGRCRIEASLTGFQTAEIACDTGPLRLVLAVAPVHETVIVGATRTEASADQVGVSRPRRLYVARLVGD